MRDYLLASEIVDKVMAKVPTEDLRGFQGAAEALRLSPLRRIACKLAAEEMDNRRLAGMYEEE